MIVGIKKHSNFHVSQQLLSMIVDKHAGISFIYQIRFTKNSHFTDFDLFFSPWKYRYLTLIYSHCLIQLSEV